MTLRFLLVPLVSFRAVALTMALGLLVDAIVVHKILVPVLIVLVGPRSRWPGRKLVRPSGERNPGARR